MPVQRDEVAQVVIDREFDELERIVERSGVLREVSPRWLDTIAATGEILSSRIVAAALDVARPARRLDRRARGDGHRRRAHAAAPLFPETTAALMAHVDPPLAAGRIPVLGGFVGATRTA